MQKLILAITNPRQLFENIREEQELLKPMLTILLVVAIASVLSLYGVDQESLATEAFAMQKELLENMGVGAEEIKAAEEQYMATAASGPSILQIGGVLISTPVGLFFIVLLWAVYFKIVSAAMNLGGSFGDWHAFVWWTRVPVAVGAIVTTILTFLLNPGTLAEVSFLSFAAWLDIKGGWLTSNFIYMFDLISVWIVIVAGIGFSVWTDKPLGISILIAALPLVVLLALVLVAASTLNI